MRETEEKKERLDIGSTPASRTFAKAWHVCGKYLTMEHLIKAWKSVLVGVVVLAGIGGAIWYVSNIDTFEGGRVKGSSIVAKSNFIKNKDFSGLKETIIGMQFHAIEYHTSAKTLLNEAKYQDALVEANNALECLRAAGIAFDELLNRFGHTLPIVKEREMKNSLAEAKETVLKTKKEIEDAIWEDENEARRLAYQKAERERLRAEQAEKERKRKERQQRDHERRVTELERKIEAEKERLKNMSVIERLEAKGYKYVDGEGFIVAPEKENKLRRLITEKDELMQQ